jgi:hypothetical protein
MAHLVSTSQPIFNVALGDEWYNPTTNKYYKYIAVNGTTPTWTDYTPGATSSSSSGASLPSQSGNAGKYLTTDGTNASWGTVSQGTTFSFNVENIATAKQIFQGNTAGLALKLFNAAEAVIISGTSLGTAGNVTANIDLSTSAVYYFNTATSGNFNFNFRTSSSTSLNNALANNESISTVVMVTNGSTGYYANSITIDGTTVVPKWQDAIPVTSGNPNSVDIYNYTIIKTSNATFTVLGSQSRFA